MFSTILLVLGLEDSPRLWYPWGTGKVKVTILLFKKQSQNSKVTLLLVSVDDMIIASNDKIEK